MKRRVLFESIPDMIKTQPLNVSVIDVNNKTTPILKAFLLTRRMAITTVLLALVTFKSFS